MRDQQQWEKAIRDMEAVDVESLSGDEFENYRNYVLGFLGNSEGISPACGEWLDSGRFPQARRTR